MLLKLAVHYTTNLNFNIHVVGHTFTVVVLVGCRWHVHVMHVHAAQVLHVPVELDLKFNKLISQICPHHARTSHSGTACASGTGTKSISPSVKYVHIMHVHPAQVLHVPVELDLNQSAHQSNISTSCTYIPPRYCTCHWNWI